MQAVNIDSVDVILFIFVPPVVALVVYAVAFAAARTAGGETLDPTTRAMLRYASLFSLGLAYIILVLGTLKVSTAGIVTALIAWATLVIGLSEWRRRKKFSPSQSPPS